MNTVTEWYVEHDVDAQDATFYRTPDLRDVAKVTLNGHSVYIAVDGETRYDFHEDDPEFPDACFKYAGELARFGIFTDADLTRVANDERGYWTFNSWFDIYDESGEHLDRVSHDIYEALSEAEAALINEDWKELA